MNRQEIESLIAESGPHCISIVIPTDKIAQYKNYDTIRKAIARIKEMLVELQVPEGTKNLLIEKLDRAQKTSFETFSHGLGIYVSEKRLHKVVFPFQVTQKLAISDAFESRDLLYLEQFVKPYFVITLTRYAVRLFKGMMNTLEEVTNQSFPVKWPDDYEYEKPSVASGSTSALKSFEKEKSDIATIRIKAMLKETDKRLMSLIKNDTKLVIAGTRKIVSAYISQSTFANRVIGQINGSFNKKNFSMLKQEAWELFVRDEKNEAEKIVAKLMEADHLVKGLEQAWKATTEGKGVLLAVDKDYHCQGYLLPNINSLFQSKPEKPFEEIPDAVDKLVKVAHDKHVPVYFMDHSEMKDLAPITLQTR